MTKPNTPPTSNPSVDPFRNLPKFDPFAPSPLDRNAAQFRSIGVNVQSAPENDRARAIPSDISSGRAQPSFASKPTPAPFPTRTDAPVPVKPQAGGSKV
jgi:hypothetical protein